MTSLPKKIQRKPSDSQEAVSFRLPTVLLADLDSIVEKEGTSRTSIIRRALAVYMRLDKGLSIIVPASKKTQEKLAMIAKIRECSEEYITSEIMRESVERLSSAATPRWDVRLNLVSSASKSAPSMTTVNIRTMVSVGR